MKKIYHIKPIYKSFIWGGRKLIDEFNLKTDLPNVGTIYTVIAVKNHLDNIVEETGGTLSELYETHPEIFDCPDEGFPIRMTITCNEQYQSMQLHPNDEYALAHEGTRGKVSGAIVLFPQENPPVTKKQFGHKCSSLDEFKKLVAEENWDELYDHIEIADGWYHHTPAGVIHGGKGSGKIAATFGTNSDITYRFYDYERNDQNRPLDLQAVYDCVNIPEVPLENGRDVNPAEKNGVACYDYYEKSGEYVAKRLKIEKEGSFNYPHFAFYTCVNGGGELEGIPIKKGETLLVPKGYGPVELKGKLDICFISYYREG